MAAAVPFEAEAKPADALRRLARELAGERSLLSAHLRPGAPAGGEGAADGGPEPALGILVGAGPRAAAAPAEYAFVIEAVREGYLLHYARPRLLTGLDPDLALLAGDYLYALGLARLARLDDPAAVALLGDLISLVALCDSEGREGATAPLWLATTIALGCGESPEIAAAKAALKGLEPNADQELWHAAEITAADSDMGPALLLAAKAIDFPAVNI